MRKLILVVLISIWALNIPVSSQTCNRTASSLKIRGFSIGMTETDALKTYPKLEMQHPAETPDQAIVNFWPNLISDELGEVNAKGLNGLSLVFLDKKLAWAKFSYEDDSQWNSLSEFTDALAKPLSLPDASEWQIVGTRKEQLQIDCKDLSLISYQEYKAGRYASSSPSLTLAILNYDAEIERRKKDAADAKKRSFKP